MHEGTTLYFTDILIMGKSITQIKWALALHMTLFYNTYTYTKIYIILQYANFLS